MEAEIGFGGFRDRAGRAQLRIDASHLGDVVGAHLVEDGIDRANLDQLAEALDVVERATRNIEGVEREQVERPLHAVVDDDGAHLGAHR